MQGITVFLSYRFSHQLITGYRKERLTPTQIQNNSGKQISAPGWEQLLRDECGPVKFPIPYSLQELYLMESYEHLLYYRNLSFLSFFLSSGMDRRSFMSAHSRVLRQDSGKNIIYTRTH
jgi:hypothetical protein